MENYGTITIFLDKVVLNNLNPNDSGYRYICISDKYKFRGISEYGYDSAYSDFINKYNEYFNIDSGMNPIDNGGGSGIGVDPRGDIGGDIGRV